MAEEKKKLEYKSTWQDQIADTTKKILNREKFSYDVNGDALYRQYKDRYMQQGKQAMMDTMGQAQAMTGGYGNSYAQSVGQQTYQGYLQGLNDKIPDLYQLALDKYTREGDRLRDDLGMMLQQENVDYGRYRDQVGDQQWQDTFDYGKARDEVADRQWQESFDYGKSRDQLADQHSAYSKLLALMTGYGYRPSDAELAAAGMSKNQRDAILGLGAYAPVEEETGGSDAYVPPKGLPDKYTKEQIQSGASDWQNKGGNPLEYVGTILNNDLYENSSGDKIKDMYDLTKKYLKNIDPNQR